ncbi:adenosylhomocysteinase [Desulforamulus hydrothermalis]|uniref:Adenosylhomocysteinase n=1 Tax=Desulforamulus hydrothermalis Lam5 = DSM 18033 TaxID=1121428 RepID=K8DZH8_9FIRM|nr:adenosylhomocysteinase [Desulforamulus hydrothermalis]CCO08489.1 Adenosylhomocysteinase [Desulforamulus hydrothermalis Lam5 = DSM 18033]SHH29447.1 adenosylhomocysteinase [Desulforamulus hydrothermalis Lam5 = DSM 18033]
MPNYLVRDIKLAPAGRLKIDWVSQHMPVLNVIREQFIKEQPFKGYRVAVCIHLEAKTAYLAEVLKAGGAEVSIAGSNPLSTQDDVAAALADAGINVYSWYNATAQEYKEHLLHLIDDQPDIVIDDGGDVVQLLHTERTEVAAKVLGGCEETTTGVLRLRSLEKQGALKFPMIAVNDAYCKYLFDNRYGTGESVWSGIMRTTNLITAGKTVVVAGYGWCGKGIAMRAKGLGAKVIVTEVDPVKAIEAYMDGCHPMHSLEAAKLGDVFITATGCKDVFTARHYQVMKDGAILCNAGHFDVEINIPDLAAMSAGRRKVRKDIEEFSLSDGRKIYLLAEGRLVNLAAGDGHPAEIMDMSFALQALSARYLLDNAGGLLNKVYVVPKEIDDRVANLKLQSLGVHIDRLTPEQAAYINEWNHAT